MRQTEEHSYGFVGMDSSFINSEAHCACSSAAGARASISRIAKYFCSEIGSERAEAAMIASAKSASQAGGVPRNVANFHFHPADVITQFPSAENRTEATGSGD